MVVILLVVVAAVCAGTMARARRRSVVGWALGTLGAGVAAWLGTCLLRDAWLGGRMVSEQTLAFIAVTPFFGALLATIAPLAVLRKLPPKR